jgi:hypothetical protein
MAIDEAYKVLNIERVPGGVPSKTITEVPDLFPLFPSLYLSNTKSSSMPMILPRVARFICNLKFFVPRKLC